MRLERGGDRIEDGAATMCCLGSADPDGPDANRLEQLIALPVGKDLFRMLSAVDLDDDRSMLRRCEVASAAQRCINAVTLQQEVEGGLRDDPPGGLKGPSGPLQERLLGRGFGSDPERAPS